MQTGRVLQTGWWRQELSSLLEPEHATDGCECSKWNTDTDVATLKDWDTDTANDWDTDTATDCRLKYTTSGRALSNK